MNKRDKALSHPSGQLRFFLKNYLVVLLCCIYLNVPATEKKERGIRGVWVPAPSYTGVLHSYKNVCEFVKLLDDLNFNCIFLVSYAEAKTVYRSKVLAANTSYSDPRQGYMLTPYIENYNTPLASPTGDPVLDLIKEAHRHKIKVFFWFEYGFMADILKINSDNPILAVHPKWLGIGNDQRPCSYNNHDYYFNGYNPEVQEYLISLIEEALTLYPELDGIQGDDRMPAMPRNSGYDSYTVKAWQADHNGSLPPADFNEASWVRWRLDKLNNFGKLLYSRVKKVNSKAIVSFAPNPYPWCEENLMQEWPQWCKDGICDLLAVQCYRTDTVSYRSTVTEVLKYIPSNKMRRLFAPGIILMEGGNLRITPGILEAELNINRSLGVQNEVYFYNEGLNKSGIRNLFKKVYTQKLAFPE